METVLKSKKEWLINDGEYRAKLGYVAFQIFNTLKAIVDGNAKNVVDELQDYYNECVASKQKWEDDFIELNFVFENKNELNTEEKFNYYNRLKYMPYRIFHSDTKQIDMPSLITQIGYVYDPNNFEVYEKYLALDFSAIFVIDFYYFLFEMTTSEVGKCEDCGDFYFKVSGHCHFCDDCSKKRSILRDKSINQDAQNPMYYIKRIRNICDYNGDNLPLLKAQYLSDRFKGKNVGIVKEYEKIFKTIKTEQDLIDKLKELHQSIKKPKKNKK